MKILLTNHSLQAVGGTEKWVYAMARELQRRQHEVEVFTFLKGVTSERLAACGIPVRTDVGTGYDLALVNHGTCLCMVHHLPAVKLFTSHGPRHPLEVPSLGADGYVAVSPEVRAQHAALGIDCRVIYNGIDLEEFGPTEDRWEPGRPSLLAACKMSLAQGLVGEACRRADVHFDTVHYVSAPEWDMARRMQAVDWVVGCGRTAYEALACNKAVLVFDSRGKAGPRADGWLEVGNVDLIRQKNCSTRTHAWPWDIEGLVAALLEMRRRWEAPPPHWMRAWAERQADVRQKADEYLAYYEEIDHAA